LNKSLKPPWVDARLDVMSPGTLKVINISWNTRLARYVKAGQHEKRVGLFQPMQQQSMVRDMFTFIQVLKCMHWCISSWRGCRQTSMWVVALQRCMPKVCIADEQSVQQDDQTWSDCLECHDVGHERCLKDWRNELLSQKMKGLDPDPVTFHFSGTVERWNEGYFFIHDA
jgi:hypothetical protein